MVNSGFRKAFILFLIAGLFSCSGNPKKNAPLEEQIIIKPNIEIKKEDQWFFDKYKDIANERVLYIDCIKLKNQKTRDMVKSIYATDKIDASKLLAFKNLEKVGGFVYADSFKDFSTFKKLRELIMSGSGESYNFIDLIELTELESIYLSVYSPYYEVDFSGIENLKKLNRLEIMYTYKPKNMDCISKLTELKDLRLHLNNGDIKFLKNNAGLRAIELFNYFDYDEYNVQRIKKDYYLTIDLQAVNELICLEFIKLAGFAINNIEAINGLQKLERAVILDCYLNPNNDYSVISDRIILVDKVKKEEGH